MYDLNKIVEDDKNTSIHRDGVDDLRQNVFQLVVKSDVTVSQAIGVLEVCIY